MNVLTLTRRAARFGAVAESKGISFAWWAWGIAVAASRRCRTATVDVHCFALRRERNKARRKHVVEAQDYARLQQMHTNIEQQLASVRAAAMNKLLRTGDLTRCIEDGVRIELKQLGQND